MSPLTQASVRDEIRKALADFAEETVRKELEKSRKDLEGLVRQALRDVAPTGEQPLRRKDLHTALDEWWANTNGKGSAKLQLHPQLVDLDPVPQRQTSEVKSEVSAPTSTTSPPSSPAFSLPPAIMPEPVRSIEVLTPLASPMMCPKSVSAPSTPLMPFSSLTPSAFSAGGGRKDWRRSFVEKATKANRKIEYIHGSQCRETFEVNEVLEEATKALDLGQAPNLVEDGLGGTYFIKDRNGNSIAVFKPRDEEPLAPNNPKVHAGQGCNGLKEGVLVGEAALNEYAAFIIDQASPPSLRAGVSPTALVRIENSVFFSAKEGRNSAFRIVKDKVGSFQLFAQHDCTSEDMGSGCYPEEMVHRLAVLDIRLCNTDRHAGNILVREERGKVSALVPIDHGYALPGDVGEATFEWLSWPAAKRPFSEALRREILAIDLDGIDALLKKRVPVLRSKCLATLRTCTLLLQRGVQAGLTAHDIGALMTRPYSHRDEPQQPSALEELVAAARRQTPDGRESLAWIRSFDELVQIKCLSYLAELKEAAGH